jgi:hypothetical protein
LIKANRLPKSVFNSDGRLDLDLVSRSASKRFWGRVNKKNNKDCWVWEGTKNYAGYGYLNLSGIRVKAHRVMWMIYNHDIPEGKIICHQCDNPGCVNPNHLFLGTLKDNSVDMTNKGRNVAHKNPEKLFRGKHSDSSN